MHRHICRVRLNYKSLGPFEIVVSISVDMMDKTGIYSVIRKLKIKVYSCILCSSNAHSSPACPFRKTN